MPPGKSIIIFAVTTCFVVLAFKSSETGKLLSNTRWKPNKEFENLAVGDTLVLKQINGGGSLYFKRNGVLQVHTWYAWCGNTTKLDRIIFKPRDWKKIGYWKVNEENNKTVLKIDLRNRDLYLDRLSQCNDSIVFLTSSVRIDTTLHYR